MQVPRPAPTNVQMVLSKTRAALAAENLDRQSALVRVDKVTHCKLAAADPGCEVCPHPEAMTETPPPMNPVARTAGATLAVVATTVEVWRSEMSLARVFALYDGWLTSLATAWVVPPVVREIAPTTMMVFPAVRLIVQWLQWEKLATILKKSSICNLRSRDDPSVMEEWTSAEVSVSSRSQWDLVTELSSRCSWTTDDSSTPCLEVWIFNSFLRCKSNCD